MEYKELIEKVKKTMAEKNISRAELARLSGLSQQCLFGFEKGGSVTIKTLAKICKALDLEFNLEEKQNEESIINEA